VVALHDSCLAAASDRVLQVYWSKGSSPASATGVERWKTHYSYLFYTLKKDKQAYLLLFAQWCKVKFTGVTGLQSKHASQIMGMLS